MSIAELGNGSVTWMAEKNKKKGKRKKSATVMLSIIECVSVLGQRFIPAPWLGPAGRSRPVVCQFVNGVD